MARFKPVRGRPKAKGSGRKGLVPCIILIIAAFVLFNLLFYAMLKSSGS